MRPACHLARRTLFQFAPRLRICAQRRCLLTLAIETSCDDTCVAILERHKNRSATLHFNSKITSDNRPYGGVYPIVAHESHQQNIAALVKRALSNLPAVSQSQADEEREERMVITDESGRSVRKKPDFVSVTRGPGARASLISGVDFAKGFAVALNIPLVAINHMQAHALTPRLVAALEKQNMENAETIPTDPPFPFLTLLVSGGHTMLVHSKDLCDHEIIANTTDIAIGDMLDKSARDVLPQILLDSAPCVMYGPLLENYAFPNNEEDGGERFSTHHAKEHSENTYGWKVNSPYARSGPRGISSNQESFSFSGIGSSAKRIADGNTNMDETERRLLAREIMRVSFEHLASRVLLALEKAEIKHVRTLVVSGGVASNQYLKFLFRTLLDDNGYSYIRLIFPPPKYCTDNAAMIAWTGIEMFEAGWRTDLSAMAIRKWSIDPASEDGGILGIGGWLKTEALR